jgi:hypothetical protein
MTRKNLKKNGGCSSKSHIRRLFSNNLELDREAGVSRPARSGIDQAGQKSTRIIFLVRQVRVASN